MPGPMITVRWAWSNRKKVARKINQRSSRRVSARNLGVKRKNRKYYIRTVTGNYKKVPANAKIWHRGKGQWSEYTKKVDPSVSAKIKRGKKYYGSQHVSDRPGSST